MTAETDRLVVGVGSSHGDDQAGWCLIDRLRATDVKQVVLRKATVPHEMIDWLGACATLHIVDACTGRSQVHVIQSTANLESIVTDTRGGGSHHVGVVTVLKLAASLRLLPDKIFMWMIPAEVFEPFHPVSAECLRQVDACCRRIREELARA